MSDSVGEIVESAIKEVLLGMDKPCSEVKSLILFGANGVLDSIALVSLIIILEEKIHDCLGVDLILANEKALSAFNSPFMTCQSITRYIHLLLTDKGEVNG